MSGLMSLGTFWLVLGIVIGFFMGLITTAVTLAGRQAKREVEEAVKDANMRAWIKDHPLKEFMEAEQLKRKIREQGWESLSWDELRKAAELR